MPNSVPVREAVERTLRAEVVMTRSLRENLGEEREEEDDEELRLEEEDWLGTEEDWEELPTEELEEEEESAQPSPGAVVEVSLLLQTPSLLLKQLNNILEE